MATPPYVHQSRYPGMNIEQFCALSQDEAYQDQIAAAGKITRADANHTQSGDHYEAEWDATVTSHLREPYLWPLRWAFKEIKSTWHEKHVYDAQDGGSGRMEVALSRPFAANMVAQARFFQDGDTLVRELTFDLGDVSLPKWLCCVPKADKIVVKKIVTGLRHSDESTAQWLEEHPAGAAPQLQDPEALAADAALLQAVSPSA